jgi:glucosamine-6-phosphate deaminase
VTVRVVICDDALALGRYAAAEVAAALATVLSTVGRARLLLSTGQSQFETLADLVRRPLAWDRIDIYHLDEYAGLPPDHPASFRRYLKERVANLVPATMHYVDPSSPEYMDALSNLVATSPMDVALVGVGENGHIAFNDPPADFDATAPFLTVHLDDRCRAQQVGEGWFAHVQDVPEQAITMSVRSIMSSRKIVSAVPHGTKAHAVAKVVAATHPRPEVPATALLTHGDATLVLDRASSRLLSPVDWSRCVVL